MPFPISVTTNRTFAFPQNHWMIFLMWYVFKMAKGIVGRKIEACSNQEKKEIRKNHQYKKINKEIITNAIFVPCSKLGRKTSLQTKELNKSYWSLRKVYYWLGSGFFVLFGTSFPKKLRKYLRIILLFILPKCYFWPHQSF